jgi:hypothetical protein
MSGSDCMVGRRTERIIQVMEEKEGRRNGRREGGREGGRERVPDSPTGTVLVPPS